MTGPLSLQRQWSDAELRRLKVVVEGGVLREVIADRFGCGVAAIDKLAKRHGWKIPKQRFAKHGSLPKPKPAGKPQHGTFFLKPNAVPFVPAAGGCPCRTLEGDEFAKRKAALEQEHRERDEKASRA